MKKRTLKLYSLILALVMLAGLAACGTPAAARQESAGAETAQQSGEAEADQPAAAEPNEDAAPSEAEVSGANTLTAYRAGGAAVLLEGGDGIWKTEDDAVYYLGDDGVLRARGFEDLYINDLAARAAAEEPFGTEPEIARQDGERFEAVIILEGMEETVRYEHIRNDALGFEMDYDYESLVRRSEGDRERFVSVWDDPAHPENYLEVTFVAEDAETAAAAIAGELSKTYEIGRNDSFMLGRAGRCISISASADVGGLTMPDQLQTVYIIPADDGCRIATEHYSIEAAEGFGRRFRYMMDSFAVLAR